MNTIDIFATKTKEREIQLLYYIDMYTLCSLFQIKEQIWEPVAIEFKHTPEVVFQNLIVLSWVPPPVARRFGCHGHQARALTAAVCYKYCF